MIVEKYLISNDPIDVYLCEEKDHEDLVKWYNLRYSSDHVICGLHPDFGRDLVKWYRSRRGDK